MFGISSVVIGDLKGIVASIMQTVFSVYGLIRYMEYYEDIKEKEIKIKTW